MTIEVARYQFHSWARRGMSANIRDTDDLGSGTVHTKERAQVSLELNANDAPVPKTFALVGPGDVIGINREMIVRTEPLNWITDFEPNYLAFIEFYDEDFAWRYTPARATGERLRPWVALLVLEEDEFERTARRVPLPSINIKDKSAMPNASETWLWAHVHSNADIPDADLSVYERFLNSLNREVTTDPDGLFCRLMSPRHLKPNTAYYAFVVPTFETGRLAALEQPTTDVDAQQPSWLPDGSSAEMPVYYEWFFRTGTNEDFESLVKLLKPRPMDPKIGIRDMDCSAPGFVRANGAGPLPATSPPIIGLEGALKSPSTVSTVFPNPPASNAFQVELQNVVNLGEQTAATVGQDPIVTMPLYGKNHVRRNPEDVVLLDIAQQAWLHDLNKDPRTRALGGCGTVAIQKNQERYMRAAWLQVEKINEANRRIRDAKAAIAAATPLYVATLANLPATQLIAIGRPVLSKIMGSPTTLYQRLQESRLPASVFSGAFRRLVRPRGALARHMRLNGDSLGHVVSGLNDGTLTAAPDRPTPDALPTNQGLGDSIRPSAVGAWLVNWAFLLILVLLLLLFWAFAVGFTAGIAIGAVAIVGLVAAVSRLRRRDQVAQVLAEPAKAGEQLSALPRRPNFNVRLTGETSPPAATPGGANGDSKEAANFRQAVTGLSAIVGLRPPAVAEPMEFPLAEAKTKVAKALRPRTAHAMRLSKLVRIPNVRWTADTEAPDPIDEVMAYPDFEEPMYKKLVDQSNELLLPNLKLIPPNTISLLETNQKVIESYMVGVNHEMARELLWREYPTDQRGSYFRQFWDVTGVVKPDTGTPPAQLSEQLKDITPIHTWGRTSLLGGHNNRDAQGDESQIVLVVRGDLLKRYPNSVVFAQKAIIENGVRSIDLELTTAEFSQQLMFPLYRAEIYPDIKFFGFDLTARQARGDDPSPGFPANDREGWFFIIQEVPGEARFGMDITFDPGTDGVTWDDLSWRNFTIPDPDFISVGDHPTGFTPTDNSPDRWAAHAANMAYVLFQKPSMVAVHAADMLENLA